MVNSPSRPVASPGPDQGSDGATHVDARGAMGVVVGDYNTQIVYTYNQTWTDGMAPPPLVSVSGVVESPYRGLRAYREQDAAFFFGRDAAAMEILSRMSRQLHGSGVLVVSGASGAGKSSLLRAGVLPRLRGAGLAGVPGAAGWPCLVFTPGRAPLDELAVRVAALAGTDAASVRRTLAADPAGFALTARQAAMNRQHVVPGTDAPAGAEGQAVPVRLLLVIDQFEQLFTLCPDEAQRRAFIAALHAVTTAGGPTDGAPAALVVAGVRADFEAQCAAYEELADPVQDRYLITPMTLLQLQTAITEPARAADSAVDEHLMQVLLADAGTHQPGALGAGVLPLLSHALDQAWRQRTGPTLTLADYERTGGIKGAVAASAQRAYTQLTGPQQKVARQVFTRLTATTSDGIDTCARATRAELIDGRTTEGVQDVQSVLDAFVAERLLTVGADSVEISHEALLTSWPLLRDTWLAETHADRIVRTRLDSVAAEWDLRLRDRSYLYSGTLLEAAAETADRITADPARHTALTSTERAFLDASLRAQRRTTRLRQSIIASLTALTLGLAIATTLTVRASQRATYERDIAISGQLAVESENIGDTDPVLARLLAVASWRLSPSAATSKQARLAMLDAAALPGIWAINGDARGILSVAFSPDGRTLASAGQDGTIRLWDIATGHEVRSLTARGSGAVWSVAFSPDGKTLAGGGDDGRIRLWDAATGRLIGTPITGSGGGITSLAFSPDGKKLATGGSDTTVRLLDVATGSEVRTPLTGSRGVVESVAFSPDGRTLASAGQDGTIRLWDIATGHEVRSLTARGSGAVWSVAFSPDGKTLAGGGDDGRIRLWDAATGRLIGTPITVGNRSAVESLAFSPDGRTLASSGADGMVRLWDVASGREVGGAMPASLGGVQAVAFSPDGKTLASGALDGTVRLWKATTGLVIGALPASSRGGVDSVAFSPHDSTVASGGNDAVQLWDAATGRLIDALPASSRWPVISVTFSPDGKTLATGGLDGVRLWDAATGRLIGTPLASSIGGVFSVAFSPDGKTLAIGGFDGMIRLWDVPTGRLIGTLRPNSIGTSSVAFSPDGKTLASGSGDGTVQLWDLATSREIGSLSASNIGGVRSMVFSPDGKTLATGGVDAVRLWDVATSREIGTPLASSIGGVSSVAFSPDGKTLAIGGFDGTVQLWDLATSREIGTPLTASTTKGVTSAAFSPDGKTLAIGGADDTVRLWNVSYLTNVVSYVCALAGRSLTRAEWTRYVTGPAFQQVCPNQT